MLKAMSNRWASTSSLLYGFHDVCCRSLAKTFQRSNLADVVGQTVDVGEVTDPAEVDEAGECLFRDAIDIHAGFRHEAGVLL
jgi:hypothetical protein